jgi:hypothetical protein
VEIASVTVAVDYDGEIAATLPHMRAQADYVYVVTKPGATRTHEIASANGCSVLITDEWHARGARFNKAGAVRLGQLYAQRAHPSAWQLIVDADIVLPTNVRDIVSMLPEEDDFIYVARRLDYHDDVAVEKGCPSREYPPIPAGFFQLHKTDRLYAEWSYSAERCDIDFAHLFPAVRMLPIVCHHLGVEAKNWKGRVTPEWNPRPVEIKR